MTARASWFTGTLILAIAVVATAEVKPTKVDIKPFRDELVVLQDRDGGTIVIKPHILKTDKTDAVDARVWVAEPTSKELWEQSLEGHSRNGRWWSDSTWSPRIPGQRPGSINFQDDQFFKICDGTTRQPLTQLTGEKAKAILDKYTFMTEYQTRRAHLLARDDTGVYYYVDRFAKKYGGSGYRVFVGKKGAMKQLALTDVATDTAGDVYSTKTGDLRLTNTNKPGGREISWIKGGKRVELIGLDLYMNTILVYSDLGIYKFMGNLCDKII